MPTAEFIGGTGKRPMGSKRFRLSVTDWQKIWTGFLVACVGAIITFLTEQIPGVDFGEWQFLAVAVASTIANFLRKLISDGTPPESFGSH